MLCVSLSCKGSFPRAHLSPYSPCRAHLWTASFPAPVLPSLVRAFLLLCAVLGQLPVIPPTPAFLFLPCLLSPPHVLPFHLPFDLSPASPFFAAKGSFLPPILQSPPVLSACLCELPRQPTAVLSPALWRTAFCLYLPCLRAAQRAAPLSTPLQDPPLSTYLRFPFISSPLIILLSSLDSLCRSLLISSFSRQLQRFSLSA
ncbi:hypothetical protein PS2_046257 [Malus domestica]